MSLPRYAEYKDSGVAWLGEVPVHWGVAALKRIVSMPITDGPHETPTFLDEGVPFVSAEAVSGGKVDFSKIRGFISPEENIRFSEKYSPALHDIYMVKSGATTGTVAIVESEREFNIWSPLAAIRCDQRLMLPYFLLNYFRSRSFQEGVTLNWSFGTQQNIGMGVLGNLSVAMPTLDEQSAIAAFLGRETDKIEALIAEQEKLLALLAEKWQATISHAVTCGLNPDVPMKDSGIPWLGMVPEHWGCVQLRRCLQEIVSGTSAEQIEEGSETVPVTRIETISTGEINSSRFGFVRAIDVQPDRLLIHGDILFSNINSLSMVGNCAQYLDDYPLYVGMNLLALRPSQDVEARWLYWVIKSATFRLVVESRAKPAINQASIPQSSISEILIVVPSRQEQRDISAFLDSAWLESRKLVEESKRAVQLLRERRSALIAAVVTGQIDVRNAIKEAA